MLHFQIKLQTGDHLVFVSQLSHDLREISLEASVFLFEIFEFDVILSAVVVCLHKFACFENSLFFLTFHLGQLTLQIINDLRLLQHKCGIPFKLSTYLIQL